MLVNAVKGYKALNSDEEAEDFIKRAHLLVKIKKEDNTDESNSEFSDIEHNVDIKDD